MSGFGVCREIRKLDGIGGKRMILLDDKEIRQVNPDECVCGIGDCRDMCKAQARKIVDIIKRDCPETLFLLEDLKFWHDLLGEIE